MSTKVKCTNCGKDLDIRGVRMHMATKHPEQNFTKYEQTSTNFNEQISRNAIEQTVQLDEQTNVLGQKDCSIAQLREEVAEKQTDLEVSQIRIAELEASLEKLPTSIGDFPATEQAAYFTEFLKNLTTEEKAKLAEETGFGVSPVPAPAAEAPLAEGYKPKDHKIILTFNRKPITVLAKR